MTRAGPPGRAALLEDAHAIYEGDPAATDVDEVIRVYPGFLAIAIYRVAPHFHRAGVPVLRRTRAPATPWWAGAA